MFTEIIRYKLVSHLVVYTGGVRQMLRKVKEIKRRMLAEKKRSQDSVARAEAARREGGKTG